MPERPASEVAREWIDLNNMRRGSDEWSPHDSLTALIERERAAAAAEAEKVAALRACLADHDDARQCMAECIARLTSDVAPLIAAFRDTPADVTEEQVDAALFAMAELQRNEAKLGVLYFDRKDVLADTATAAAAFVAETRRKAWIAGTVAQRESDRHHAPAFMELAELVPPPAEEAP
jgi:hypothetical protein